jgi:hypothetical protein
MAGAPTIQSQLLLANRAPVKGGKSQMNAKKSQLMKELTKFGEALWIELPFAATMRLAGQGDDDGLREAGWKTYDAWIRLANEATNRVYASSLVAGISGRLIVTALQTKRVGDTLTSAVFGNLWPAIGIPTASEIHALRAEVAGLRDEIRASIAARDERHTIRPQPVQPALPADEGLHVIWKSVGSRSGKGVKKDAAA